MEEEEEARGIGRCANPLRYSRYFPVIAFAVLHSYLRNPFSTYTRILSIIITSLAREIAEMLCQTRLIVVRSHRRSDLFLFFFFFARWKNREYSLLANINISITTRFLRRYFLGEKAERKDKKWGNAWWYTAEEGVRIIYIVGSNRV